MNTLYSAVVDNFWFNVAEDLEAKMDMKPVYWVGHDGEGRRFQNCFYHDVWKAFSLQDVFFSNNEKQFFFDIECLSRIEYYNYLKILDRIDGYGGFSFSERDNLLKRQLNYWFRVLEILKVGCVFFSNAPHMPYDYPLYLVSKKLGIKTIILNTSSIKGWHYVTDEIGGPPLNLKGSVSLSCENIFQEAVEPFLMQSHRLPWYMAKQKKRQESFLSNLITLPFFSLMYFSWLGLKKWLSSYGSKADSFLYYGKFSSLKLCEGMYVTDPIPFYKASKIKVLGERKKRKLKKEYDRLSCQLKGDLGKYVYFPLHYQPELTTTPLGDGYSDQFHVIREISSALPDGYQLVVKEHPSQFSNSLWGQQGRDFGFWEEISNIDNVVLASLETSSIKLMKESQAVITITGTAGWEAVVNGKPCVVLGKAWYQKFPQIFKPSGGLKSALLEALSNGGLSRPDCDQLKDMFFSSAIKNDIHGVLSEDVVRDSYLLSNYIKNSYELFK